MKTIKICRILLLLGMFTSLAHHVFGLDFPTYYRTMLSQDTPLPNDDGDWQTALYVTGLEGSTHHSFNSDGHQRPLYDAHGLFDMPHLGINVETKTTTMQKYWSNDDDGSKPFDTPCLSVLGQHDGKYSFSGKFKALECNIRLKQNIVYGLYLHAFLPLKELKMTNIVGTNKGPTIITTENGTDEFVTNMDTFYNTDLPKILQENGLHPLTESYKTTGVSDVIVGAGWQRYTDKLPKGLLSSLGGFLEIGAAIPIASERDPNRVFAIERGFNHEWMVYLRANLQAGLWKFLNIGVEAGSTILIRNNRHIRLQTDKNQNGWIKLEYGEVEYDAGSRWDVGCYVQTDNKLFKGFSVLVGYTYSMQESTNLELHDDRVLSSYATRMLNQTSNPTVISKDDIINSDKNLLRWDTHQLHFVAQCDLGEFTQSWIKPILRFEYDVPVVGKYSWLTDIIAGMAGIRLAWSF